MYKAVLKTTGVGYEYTVDFDGAEHWYLEGLNHREDGPAYRHPDGTERWYLHGDPHRPDGPAVKLPDGLEAWYLEGYYLEPDQIETMKHLLVCPLEELPLKINTIFKPVVEWRLKNEP